MKKQTLYSVGLFVGAIALGCGGSGAGGTGPTFASFGSFTAELIGAAQPPVTTSTSFGANATGIAGAQFDKISLTASGANTLADTKITFSSSRDSANYEVYSMNADGTNPIRLTNNAAIDYDSQYSPNGSKILFVSARDGNYEVYSMSADGTNQTRLTNNATTDYEPSWSPDGSKILFTSTRDAGNYEIYSMNSDGSNQVRLTNHAAIDLTASWSPDGTKIAFCSDRDGNYEIYTMNSDGSNPIRLTNNASSDTYASWSPDGTKIVFSSFRDSNLEIYTMNADGTSQTRVTNMTTAEEIPSYSPDGSKILFNSDRDGNGEIYAMNTNGSSPTNLSKLPSIPDSFGSWSGFLPRTPKNLVGAGGALGTASAGFIFTQIQDQVQAVLSFDTTVQTLAARAASRVSVQSNDPNATSLIFSITTASGLASIKYAPVSGNGTPGTVSTYTMPSGATAALVSFGSSQGLLGSILPYTATRAPLSKPIRVGNELTFSGSFGALLDGEGKVIAPTGATSVTINELTGKVVRFN